jgi:aldehyde dehydrogenase (NAD+)
MAAAETHFGLQIAGEEADAASAESAPLIDPSTGGPIGTVSVAGANDVDRAVDAARSAFEEHWWDSAPVDRGRLLMRIAEAIRANAAELAEHVMRNTGHPQRFALGDAENAARYFEYYAGAADKIHGESIPVGAHHVDFTVREPWGVCGIISPFNAPLQLPARSIAPALAAGNTVVLKPGEQSPAATLALGRVMAEAGVPAGVVNIVPGALEAGQRLIAHPDVAHITFTGSVTVGQAIMRAAAEGLKPVTLELGGKSPQILFDDADVEAAVAAVMGSAVLTAGQVCSAGTRILVQNGVHDAFVDALGEAVRGVTVGPPAAGAEMGPVITGAQRDRVAAAIARGRAGGARVVAGGEEAPDGLDGGFFVRPTVFDQVAPDSALAREEIFGPVLAVMRFDDWPDALAMANDSEFGLVAGVWTREIGRAHHLARKLRVGQVFINNYGVGGGVELPFGGYKKSGIGREKGLAALGEYTQLKNVCVLTDPA